MSDLGKKEQSAIKILKMYRGDSPIELSYSGGKDSDVILALANMANINYRAIYKNTTIDPPGTVKHCKDNGVEIMMPKTPFLDIIRKKGFPTRRARFCCEILKEYKVLDNAIQGIRKEESTARAKRYKEPIVCRMYNKSDHVNLFLPILDWSNEDVSSFIRAHGIRCHDLYYKNDIFDVRERLGCIGCPMASDNGLSDFIKYPKMVRQWIKAAQQWWDTPREKLLGSKKKFDSVYALFAYSVFFDNYDKFQAANTPLTGGKENWKQRLEDFFRIDL